VTLVVIYGAPAVGKLTTARALADLTGFRVFHNHLTWDLVRAVFDFPTPPFGRLAETIRLATFEATARENLPGLIFTLVYACPEDDQFVQRMLDTVERHGGEVAFVRLTCDKSTNEQRVRAEDRGQFGKVTTVDALRWVLAQWNCAEAIPFRPSLEIDNSALDAAAVARQIALHFRLPIGVKDPRPG
jgi:hypothetical protein